jgi:Flp pilus assembly protein TadB
MALFFRQTLFLFVLAAICYALAIFVTGGRVGFIVFFVVGLLTEPAFYILSWRQRRNYRRHRIENGY